MCVLSHTILTQLAAHVGGHPLYSGATYRQPGARQRTPNYWSKVCFQIYGMESSFLRESGTPHNLITDSVIIFNFIMGFSGGSAGKESACNIGDLGLTPGLGRSPGEGKGCPLQSSGLENSMDCRVHGVTKSQTWLSDDYNFIMYCRY